MANYVTNSLSNKLQAVDSKYAGMGARVGPDQEVMFEDRKITLDIPEDGISLGTGWMITPLTHPGVRLHLNPSTYSLLRYVNHLGRDTSTIKFI